MTRQLRRAQPYNIVGNFTLPHLIALSPFVTGQSGNPYNITAGTDLNNDSFFNDRPTFLPGENSASCTNASTFNKTPTGNYTPIPINYCTGPLCLWPICVLRRLGALAAPVTVLLAAAEAAAVVVAVAVVSARLVVRVAEAAALVAAVAVVPAAVAVAVVLVQASVTT